MPTEREVRTRAGWIGVEISKSRVRTPGKAGYGLYRVRTAAERHWHVPHPVTVPAGEWTAYAFTLDAIDAAVRYAIERGTPTRPGTITMVEDISLPARDGKWASFEVPTRWTHRYQGRRDLGVSGGSPMGDRLAGSVGGSSSVRSRRREYNAAFQAEHAVRRGHGLKARHAGRGRDA